jgi:hypothetical protein
LFSRKRNPLAIYVYTVAYILVLILHFWACENKLEWFSLKREWTVKGNYTTPQHFENADAKEREMNNESQNLEHDIAVICFPKDFDMDNKVELTVIEAQCLIKELLDKLAPKQDSINIHTHNATISDSFINLLAFALHRNGKSDIEACNRRVEIQIEGNGR